MTLKPIALTFAAIFGLSAAASQVLTVEVVNNSGQKAFVKFTGNSLAVDKAAAEVAAGATATFALTSVSAGRIYFSYGKPLAGSKEPDGANTSDPNYSLRFDKAELTYTQSGHVKNPDGTTTVVGAGKANLTAVDHYAIPLLLQTFIKNAYDKNRLMPIDQFSLAPKLTGNALLAQLSQTIDPASKTNPVVKNGRAFVRILSPVKRPAAYVSMKEYVGKSVGRTMALSGTYFGPVCKDYSYSGKVGSDNIVLSMPNEKSITVATASLFNAESAIYTCNGKYLVGTTPSYVSKNDFWAAVYRDLVSAYNFGYVAGNYGDNSAKWWSKDPFGKANKYYNKYAAAVAACYPGAYGFPFSDRQRHVLADLGGQVDTLRFTLLGDDQPPPLADLPGVVNPTTGKGRFNAILVFAQSIQDVVFKFGNAACKGGYANNYSGGTTGSSGSGMAAQVNGITAQEGYNKYDLTCGSIAYRILVYVKGGQVLLAAVVGGGDMNWVAATKNLFIGGLQPFVNPPKQMSQGSVVAVSAADLDGAELDAFARAPSVYALHGDGARKLRLKVLTTQFPAEEIQCAVMGKAKLGLLNEVVGAQPSLWNTDPCVLHVDLKDGSSRESLFHAGDGTLCGPLISSVTDADGAGEVQLVYPGQRIVVHGQHFGKNPPRMCLRYVRGGMAHYIPRDVLRPLRYQDEAGQAGTSCMDLTSADGDSQVTIQIPYSLPIGWFANDSHAIILDNGVDRAFWPLPDQL